MLIKKFAVVLMAASFAACGTSKNESDKATSQPAPETAAAATTEAAAIPNFFVIRVPVDANGNEIAASSETKTFSENDFAAAESTGLAFEKGTSVSLVDELDQDSSTSQWFYRGYRGGYYGRGYYGGGYYGSPYYSYYGNSYNYGYYNYYNYNSCNYYVYASPYYY